MIHFVILDCAQMGMQAMTYPQSFLSEFNMYMTHFVLHNQKQLQQPTSHLWSLLEDSAMSSAKERH
jgi:hypothetical protein